MQPHVASQLPEVMDFLQLAEKNRQFDGALPLTELGRLHGVLNSTEGEVTVKLSFGLKLGLRCLTGSVSAKLNLVCQRCLNPLDVRVESEFCFALISDSSDMENLPDEMEPYYIEGDKQSIKEVVIDELLISIPLVVKHNKPCSVYMNDQDDVVETKTYKPFASIKDLLRNI